jgi:hypothetical protein
MRKRKWSGPRILWPLLAFLGGLFAFADWRWRARSRELVRRSRRIRGPLGRTYSSADLAGLPESVVRYFRAVLPDGQPIVRFARFSQRGEFLLKPEAGAWSPFRADQTIATNPAGFVWDARIRMTPGVSVRVRDSFVEGVGSMLGSVLGVFPVVRAEGTPEIAEAALQRYLAEAVWFPTALLPSCGVVWTPLDGSSARAALTAGGTTVSVDFRFGEDGFVREIFTPARSRQVGSRAVPTPWRGRFSVYGERGGMRIPLAGEVEWLLPEGPQPYWKARLLEIAYEFELAGDGSPRMNEGRG